MLLMQGGCNPHTGYGKIQLGLYREFIKAGVDVQMFGRVNPLAQGWLKKHNIPLQMSDDMVGDVVLMFYRPQIIMEWWELLGRRLWLYTMSESTRVGRKWVAIINRLYERVFVPSPELVKVYQDSGVTVPVHCVGCGMDFYEPEPGPQVMDRPETFIWLTQSNGDLRKGADKTIQAFMMLHNGDTNYQLWIKAANSHNNWLSGCTHDQIVQIGGWLSEFAWFELLRNVHGFAWPSRGEGYGLMAREAVLTGTPTIATKWMGMDDAEQWAIPLNIEKLWRSQFEQEEANHPEGEWAEADINHLMEQMTWVENNYQVARDKAAQGRDYLQGFKYHDVAQGVLKWL